MKKNSAKHLNRTFSTFVIVISTAVLVLLIALTTPALADGGSWDYDGFPLTTKSTGTINGGVFISYGDNDKLETAKTKPYVTNFSVPNGTPKWAKLYMHLWGGNPNNGGTVNVTFNGHAFDTVVIAGKATSDPQVLGAGCGTWWLFFNVTDNVTPGAINRAEGRVTTTNMDGRCARMVLIEAYEGGDDPQNLMYWVNDGHINMHYNSSDYNWCLDKTKAWFNGTVPSGVSEANLTGVWLTGSYQEPDYLYFSPTDASDAPNGNNLNWNISKYSAYQFGAYDPWTGNMSYRDVAMGGGWFNNYFDMHSNTTTNTSSLVDVLKTDNNYAIFWRGHDDNSDGWIYGAFTGDPTTYEGEGYVHPVVAVLVLSLGAQPEQPDLTIDGINAFHYDPTQKAWFNLSNEVNVTVKNNGTADAGAFNVSLYANDEMIGKQSVPGLHGGNTTILQFLWTPVGCDCEDGCSPVAYTLKAIADCDNSITESNETNNESTAVETVYWTGYMNDESLARIIHGTIRGGLDYTTGNGKYSMLYLPGSTATTQYEITLPDGADVELARLNIYYTWSKGPKIYPEMEVSITNTSGTYILTLDASYNDRPCTGLAFDYPFGNYVYNVAPYITGSGSYTVVVKNNGTMPPPTSNFCIAAPGIVLVYEDNTKPEYEYWLIEGADLLEGGRRSGAGSLALDECINNATFTGDIDTGKMKNATLGIVSAWGGAAWGEWTSYYWFNDIYLGDGSIMGGYSSLYNRAVDGVSMYVGASGDAQVGANVSDVTTYIAGSDNTVSFGDDGDSMMPTNAFLVVEYKEEAPVGGQVWYLTSENKPEGAPTANDSQPHAKNNLMHKGSSTGTGTSFSLNSTEVAWFYADTGAACDIGFGEQPWEAHIRTEAIEGDELGRNLTVEICRLDNGTGNVTVLASNTTQLTAAETKHLWNLTCEDNGSTTQDLSTSDWLAVRLSWDCPTDELQIHYKAEAGSDSYIESPSSDPGYPIPELQTLILFATGLIALAGFVLLKKGRNKESQSHE